MRDSADRPHRRDEKTAQEAPGATIVTSVDLQVPLILNVGAPQSRLSGMKGVENSRAVEDDMDTATLWTHRTRPQGLEISHRTRDSHSVHIAHCFLEKKKQELRRSSVT
jgi:hypothetical protein